MSERARWLTPIVSLLLGGCLYSFSGGGGLPSHIQTIYVPPVENETTRFVLTERVTQGLLDAVRDRLGLNVASEESADAVIRATVTRYSDEAMSFEGREGLGARVFQRRVTVTASVEIYDLARDELVWRASGVAGSGEYAPDQESEETGLGVALENLIQEIVNGAQSQW